MKVKCNNPDCLREWNYKGKKKGKMFYVSCPDCHKQIKTTNKEIIE